jgi:hypothetical protein
MVILNMGEFHFFAKHDERFLRSMMTARVIMPTCSLLVLSNHK